jgi:hypothetical protein
MSGSKISIFEIERWLRDMYSSCNIFVLQEPPHNSFYLRLVGAFEKVCSFHNEPRYGWTRMCSVAIANEKIYFEKLIINDRFKCAFSRVSIRFNKSIKKKIFLSLMFYKLGFRNPINFKYLRLDWWVKLDF